MHFNLFLISAFCAATGKALPQGNYDLFTDPGSETNNLLLAPFASKDPANSILEPGTPGLSQPSVPLNPSDSLLSEIPPPTLDFQTNELTTPPGSTPPQLLAFNPSTPPSEPTTDFGTILFRDAELPPLTDFGTLVYENSDPILIAAKAKPFGGACEGGYNPYPYCCTGEVPASCQKYNPDEPNCWVPKYQYCCGLETISGPNPQSKLSACTKADPNAT